MTNETMLRQTLQRAATAIPDDDPQLDQVVRRGRRRRHRNRGSVVAGAAVVALGITAGIGGSVLDLPGSSTFAAQTPANPAHVVVYLCTDTPIVTGAGQACDAPATEDQIRQLRSSLALDEAVVEVELETQQQAYERFSELFADQPELVESVTPDTLPASLRITLVEGAPIDGIVAHYRDFGGVEAVVEPETD